MQNHDFIRQQVKIGFRSDSRSGKESRYRLRTNLGNRTGKIATTEQAQEVCGKIRECIAEVYDDATAAEDPYPVRWIRNSKTAADLFAQADIDGGLVGGASLKEEFGQIVKLQTILTFVKSK